MMRIPLKTLLVTLASFLVIAGCAGGGDDDDDAAGDDDDDGAGFTLTDGTYLGSGSVQNTNNCGAFTGSLDGVTFGVTVVGSSIALSNGMTLIRTGDALAGSGNGTAALPDCQVDAAITDTGSVTADDTFHLNDVSNLSNGVGTGCVNFTLPCTLDVEATFTKQ